MQRKIDGIQAVRNTGSMRDLLSFGASAPVGADLAAWNTGGGGSSSRLSMRSTSFHSALIQPTFLEHLLCRRVSSRHLGYISGEGTQKSLLSQVSILPGHEGKGK